MVEPTIQSIGLGLASAAKILQSLKELVGGDAKAQVTALYDVILSAQAGALEANLKQSAMVDRIRDLEAEITRVKAWESQKQRYKLNAPWPERPAVVYALKETMSESEPPHWICTKCYEDGKRMILQPGKNSDGYILLVCPECKSVIHTGYRGINPASYV